MYREERSAVLPTIMFQKSMAINEHEHNEERKEERE